MQVNNVSLQAFAMSLCHQMQVDANNEKTVKGVYLLVLEGDWVMRNATEESGFPYPDEMDDFWCKLLAKSLEEILAARGMPPPPGKEGNIEKMVKGAVENISNPKGFYLATTMADVFELSKVREDFERDERK